ncbi:photosystem reaction center subunit H [Pedobacter psychrophilus]|uniref:Photosystem reaction center subunit H n=1 Tax=Pedobacter psychrophilus TaxID=1826909 RepID=A0A179DCH2_9SPHI|nr:photosystem reaction center subunit H [Pedobacter psychrophilus]OAQ38741.1 photosystem reaction center subunit H [Pedobacter psychrophilus]
MKNENKDLVYLHDLSGYKVAKDYPDVRDWDVQDNDFRKIGKVDALLVSKIAERVVYLDVEVDESVIEEGHEVYGKPTAEGIHEFLNKDGDDHLIIPIGLVKLDEENKIVHASQINYSTFVKTSRYSKGNDISRDYELGVYKNYVPDYDDANDGDDFYRRDAFNI